VPACNSEEKVVQISWKTRGGESHSPAAPYSFSLQARSMMISIASLGY